MVCEERKKLWELGSLFLQPFNSLSFESWAIQAEKNWHSWLLCVLGLATWLFHPGMNAGFAILLSDSQGIAAHPKLVASLTFGPQTHFQYQHFSSTQCNHGISPCQAEILWLKA